MSEPEEPHRISLADILGAVLETVTDIGRTLASAGWDALNAASRIYAIATGASDERAPEEPPTGTPSRAPEAIAPRAGSSAVALDREATPAAIGERATLLGDAPGRDPGRDRVAEATPDLPRHYGQDRLVVLPRQPGVLFVTWEMTPVSRARVLRGLEPIGDSEVRDALRIVVVEDPPPEAPRPDWILSLPPHSNRHYAEVSRLDRRFAVSIGLLVGGRFVPVLGPILTEAPASPPATREDDDRPTVWRSADSPETEVPPPPDLPAPGTLDGLLASIGGARPASSIDASGGARPPGFAGGASHSLPTG